MGLEGGCWREKGLQKGRGGEGRRELEGGGLGCVERFKGGKEVYGCSEEAGYA